MRFLHLSFVLLAACGESPATSDASIADASDASDGATEAAEWCDGDIKSCCTNDCFNDVGMTGWICVGGARVCPAGSYSDVECKKKYPCVNLFCALPPEIPKCLACDGGAPSQSTCDADAGHYACPAQTYIEWEPDASTTCAADAGID